MVEQTEVAHNVVSAFVYDYIVFNDFVSIFSGEGERSYDSRARGRLVCVYDAAIGGNPIPGSDVVVI